MVFAANKIEWSFGQFPSMCFPYNIILVLNISQDKKHFALVRAPCYAVIIIIKLFLLQSVESKLLSNINTFTKRGYYALSQMPI